MESSGRKLSDAQQETLSEEKIDYKIQSERYLRFEYLFFDQTYIILLFCSLPVTILNYLILLDAYFTNW